MTHLALSPRPARAARNAERGSAAVWIIALLVLGGVAFAIYWFGFRGGAGSAQSSSLAGRVLPADVDVVGGVDIARIVSDSSVREFLQKNGTDLAQVEAQLAEHGVKLSDLEALVFGGRLGEANLKDALIAVQAKTDAKALVGMMEAMLTIAPPEVRAVVSGGRVEALDGGVVLTGSGELLDKALAVAKGAAPALGSKPGLDEIRAALDTSAILWVASPIPSASLAMLPGMLTGSLGKPSHFGFSAALGSSVELRAAVLLPGKEASDVASSLKFMLGMVKSKVPEAQRALLENLELSGSGAVLVAKITLSQAELEAMIKKGM